MIENHYSLQYHADRKNKFCYHFELTSFDWAEIENFFDFFTPLVEELVSGHVVMYRHILSSDGKFTEKSLKNQEAYDKAIQKLDGKTFCCVQPKEVHKNWFGRNSEPSFFCAIRNTFSKEILIADYGLQEQYAQVCFYNDEKIDEAFKNENEIFEYFSNKPASYIAFDNYYLAFHGDERVCSKEQFVDAVRKVFGNKVSDFSF